MKQVLVEKENVQLSLFNKHARITSSPIYLCYLLLRDNVRAPGMLREDKNIPIYTLFNQIRKISPRVPGRQIYFAIFLMYALKLIEFERPYITIKKHDKNQ
ncbi:MAG: hypothetical protein A2747_02845 [Candidatus Yonathbacteria bacterium RIFCSPHIGHO2_01_FULL_44_41]|uniref:Uncharacterized protein n=1 Tax=Candidatus Yonathbacteria bacterium RIFCSPHIGHO2_02_FULL_44_14 TaxID=1802724 RepID=A0A1G2S8F0_9BACT|nr:MAG: hypothetical protein A2747_02845 [Candidatus Yonathbacteria bacterium RIFCSPHIGHO2_01_FULL_44_41]OHA80551.1 MAG: hypothetical protein A3D51_00545 [Candidatus Yonathbacteria bacterium RIFCSPHIGHO2_02_FULL_44_14]OHA82157.1 MAG: hypothetical protein A3B06_01450 [Candidatus Yonathbacteria bacterium RIFCSPLOWO2_01_FULL_43_20]